jgi:RNA polymerase sigma factor (sigma-70 family)
MNPVLRHVRWAALLGDGGGLTDGQLLEQFLLRRDEDAFAGLLRRHGPMVLAVCRRVLGDEHYAEDACQATFLVLARKAGSVHGGTALGSWLHSVAYRTSLKARTMMARQRARERAVSAHTQEEASSQENLEELLQHLDDELHSLPEKYRLPVVLCELEGRSRKAVASQLQIPEGTLSSWLAYAKKLLARRLSRNGAALSVGAVTLVLTQGAASASLPSSFLTATAKAATGRTLTAGAVSAQVLMLVEGVMKAMLLSKLKLVCVVAVAVSISAGAAGLTYRATASPTQQATGARAADDWEELRLEIAALRKGLQTTRDRVKVLEEEVQALRGHVGAGGSMGSMMHGMMGMPGGQGAGGASTIPGMPGGGGPAPDLPGGPVGQAQGASMAQMMQGMKAGGAMMPGVPGAMGMPLGPTAGGSNQPGAMQPMMGGGMGPYVPGSKPPTSDTKPENALPKKHLRVRLADDPVANAETLLRRLKDHPDDKEAADALERAVRRLKERAQPKTPKNNLQ